MRPLAFAWLTLSAAAQAEQNFPSSVEGINAGLTKAQVIAQLGEPKRCAPGEIVAQWCAWENSFMAFMTVSFENDLVTYAFVSADYSPHSQLPFDSLQGMRQQWGHEDILAVSESGFRVRATYIEPGLTVNFDDGEFSGYALGNLGWRASATLSQYHVLGRQVCPSDDLCPFELPSRTLRAEFTGMTVLDLLKQKRDP